MAEKRHGNEAATRTTPDAGPINPNNVSRNFVLLTKAGKQRHAAKAQEMIRDAKAASLPTMPLLDETI